MGTEFSLPLKAEGSVTAPTDVFSFVEPAAESEVFLDIGEVNILDIPEFDGRSAGWALADGVNPLRFVTRSAVYDAGGLAPKNEVTLGITSGGHANVVGTWSGQPLDGEYIWFTIGLLGLKVVFKTTLVTDGTENHQVKIGATDDETYQNVQALINLSGSQGTEYWSPFVFSGIHTYASIFRIEVYDVDTVGKTITFRYTDQGTYGNSVGCTENATNFSFASATFTGGGDGTGTEPDSGTYRFFYAWFRDADGAETGRSPIATIRKTTNTNIAVSGLTGSADTTYDYVNIYRTAREGVEFYLVGTVARATATFTDGMSDGTLVRGSPWNDLNYRFYTEGMPPRGRALALWKGSIWTLGAHIHAEYSKGEVVVTNGSDAISFVKAGTANALQGVSELMVGRTFQVTATSEEYTLLSVNETAATGVIDRDYEGSTDAHVGFTIRDTYDPCRLRRCVQFKYNQWPVDESPGRIDTDDAEGGTALLATKARLFAFSRTSVTSVTGEDAESWVLNKITEGVGCVAPRMVVGVEGGGIFLSRDGFYAISPDESVICISSPKAVKGTLAQGIDGTVARISWGSIDQGYSSYDPTDRVLVFGVPLDGATSVTHDIVFDIQNSVWALYKRSEWTAMAQGTLNDGGLAMLSGDRHGHIWHAGIGESDGFYGAEALQTLSGAQTVRVLTVSGTPFSTSGDGEDGKPVIILYADGETVAYGKVASNTTSALTLAEDLDTAPAANDQILLGGIGWQAKSGFTTFGEEYRTKNLRSVTIRHAPTTRGDYFFSFAVDDGAFNLCPVGTSLGDLTDDDGKIRHMVQWPGDTHAINIRGFKPGGQAILRGGVFDLVLRENGRM